MTKTDKGKWIEAQAVDGRRSPEKEMKDFYEKKGSVVICAKIHSEGSQGFERYIIL